MADLDGLSELAARRSGSANRRHRQPPPPRHPVATSTEDTPPETVAPEEAAASSPEAVPTAADIPSMTVADTEPELPAATVATAAQQPARMAAPAATRRMPPATTAAAAPAEPAERSLRLAQFYIDADDDDWLRREIRAASLIRGVDVSGSAVVRLALRRLREQMTGEEVITELGTARATGNRGRTRR